MSNLFRRVVELYADKKQFGGDFTIYFDVPFDDGDDANVAEIKIYNLTTQSINEIKKGSKIILNAGYSGDAGSILLGEAQTVKTEWERVDKITTITVLDGSESWLKMPIKKTYKEGIKAKQILNDILAITGLEIGAVNLPTNKVYKGGKTINTTLQKAIAQIAKDCGAKTHVNRGKIFIRPKNEGDNIGFVLDAEHGLISSPMPIEKEDKQKNIIKGFKVVSLLNHRIATDSLLQIKSKTANGIFRVESGKHYANGRAFYTEMECYPI